MLNTAVINLTNLKNNALKIRQKLPKNTRFCAVVKADAYGHGAQAVASALYQIVDCYAVALVEEGITLRQSGIDKEILVLIPPFESDIKLAVAYSLTLTVQDVRQLKMLERECQVQNKRISAQIKFNSGMNRLGIDDLDKLEKLLDQASKLQRVKIGGVYSHYACPQNKKLLDSATDKFLLANNLLKGYNKNSTNHVSASGGFLQGVYMDMVRIGIMLYGYTPYPCDFDLKPIMKVYAPVVKTGSINSGETLLYGDKLQDSDRLISIIRYGYADGLERAQNHTLLNNRCMDLSAVSRCKTPCFPIMENADVTAGQHGTISYEVLTKCAMRCTKIYTD